MYILSRKQGQIIDIIYCGKVIAQILVKNIGRSNVELGFTGQKDKILFVRGEKVILDKRWFPTIVEYWE